MDQTLGHHHATAEGFVDVDMLGGVDVSNASRDELWHHLVALLGHVRVLERRIDWKEEALHHMHESFFERTGAHLVPPPLSPRPPLPDALVGLVSALGRNDAAADAAGAGVDADADALHIEAGVDDNARLRPRHVSFRASELPRVAD